MTKTAPLPAFGTLAQATFNRVAMYVTQLLDALELAPYVEVVVTRLPENACVGTGDESMGGDLLQHLKRGE